MWALVGSLQAQHQVTWVTKWQLSRMDNGVSQLNRAGELTCLANIPKPLQPGSDGNLSIKVDADGVAYTRNAAFWTGCYFPSELYSASIYWSVMTLTSIGYGDIVPVNRTESLFVIFCMVMGGVCWAYILGSICASAANLNPAKAEFQRTMDDLNRFMDRRGIDSEMQLRFRAYFINTRSSVNEAKAQHLVELMSPALAAECVAASHPHLREQVFFLKDVSRNFMVSVVAKFRTETFGPTESAVRVRTLMVLQRGVVSLEGRLMLPGSAWGEDLVLDTVWLRRRVMLSTLTFVEISSLTRDDLDACLLAHPYERQSVRRSMLPFMLKRAAAIIGKLVVRGELPRDKDAIMARIRDLAGVTKEELFNEKTLSPKAATPSKSKTSQHCWGNQVRSMKQVDTVNPKASSFWEIDSPGMQSKQVTELKQLLLQMQEQQQITRGASDCKNSIRLPG